MLLKFLAVKTSFLSNECVFQRKTMHCFQKNQSKYVCFHNSNGSFFPYISKSVCFLFYESFIWLCKNLKIIVEKYVSKEQKAGISDASLHKKWSFPLRISSVNGPNPQETADLVHLLKKSFMENFTFCAVHVT